VTYRVTQMTPEEIDDMCSWRYEPPYDFYDGDIDPILNPERFFAVRDESGELVGNYYFEHKGDVVEYGLGLRPGLTGKGLGLDFFRAGLDFARRRYSPTTFTLAVAAFNARAITVYERAGFTETGRHIRHFERFGDVEFVDMELAE
jgi:ribosomal-protein-alanine N-acetyltransferase